MVFSIRYRRHVGGKIGSLCQRYERMPESRKCGQPRHIIHSASRVLNRSRRSVLR